MTNCRYAVAGLLFVLLACGCVRTTPFDPREVDTGSDAGNDPGDTGAKDVVQQDAIQQASDAHPEQQADSGQPRRLSCGAPTPTGGAVANNLHEPALRVDGLTIYAHASGAGLVVATRPGLDQPFGAWTAGDVVPPDAQDPAFFSFGGRERAIVSLQVQSDPYRRRLHYCATVPAASCAVITVVDGLLGNPISDDMDGPSVAVVGGEPVMVFNVSSNNAPRSANVFQATPTVAGDLLHWTAEPLTAMSRPNLAEDDPAVSADGTIVVYDRPVEGEGNDVWVALRDSPFAPLSAPEALGAINTAGYDASTEIFQLSAGAIELYFSSQRGGEPVARIYRSLCRY